MTFLPVTIAFISFYAISVTIMTAWIGLYRGKINVLRGYGDDPILFKRSRYHGNFIENAPVMALALGAAESLGLGQQWLWAAFVSFIIGRALHFFLFDRKIRGLSMSATQIPAAMLAVWCLFTLRAGVA
ncbi:MAG: MAPEG family protein [Rhodobacteraceae bacterium]|nr:MAPEG family protein [Paracoccaceae bacterium]